ncbi:MAG: cystathionine beta-lyase [Hyphomonadaceae bacterium BRH_c29]|nr:MAG: cystathionine beta-lyase [Hyphomonadaceae bacterium BRH_c29]
MKRPETRIIHTRGQRLGSVTVNPPVERASTVLFQTEKALYDSKPGYGRMGLSLHRELEAALCELEGASHVRLASNGLQACVLAIASCVEAGGHVLFPDSAYGPTARFCERRLKIMGVSATRYDPRIGGGIADMIRPETQAIFIESPGSLTFELSDIPAITTVARERGIPTIVDNTWGAGYFLKPLALGADIVVHAMTKYIVGHADAFGGAVITSDNRLYSSICATSEDYGIGLAPDDAYLALRGLRTLHTRLHAHEAAALDLANWLAARPEVSEVLHPALPSSPDHTLWKRDFTGSSGLFGVILNAVPEGGMDRFLAELHLFGMGFSWGGFESLLIPCDEQLTRSTGNWTDNRAGPLLRIHVGLEAVSDLKAELDTAFAALKGPA